MIWQYILQEKPVQELEVYSKKQNAVLIRMKKELTCMIKIYEVNYLHDN